MDVRLERVYEPAASEDGYRDATESAVRGRREMHRGTHCGWSGERRGFVHGAARNPVSHLGPCRRTCA